jgi:hypothetical protein
MAAASGCASASSTGLRRGGNEKFYTRDAIAQQCVADLVKVVTIDPDKDLLLEPSAGSGAFLPHLEQLANCLIALDIEPESNDVLRQDFLAWDGTELQLPRGGRIITVGNPPFGQQASLAFRFIKHAAKFSEFIAFILPRSFMKPSMQARVPLEFHLVHQRELDLNAFTIDDRPHYVPCVFQIWQRHTQLRPRAVLQAPTRFTFTTREAPHHFALRRVGVNAGTITAYPGSGQCSCQTHYFICLLQTTNIPDIIRRLQVCEFKESQNTVGIKSISKREVVECYDNVLSNIT